MPISDDQFREIEARWRDAFSSPYDARAESWDYGKRVALAVFLDGEKVFEERDNLGGHLVAPGVLEAYAAQVRQTLRLQHPH